MNLDIINANNEIVRREEVELFYFDGDMGEAHLVVVDFDGAEEHFKPGADVMSARCGMS